MTRHEREGQEREGQEREGQEREGHGREGQKRRKCVKSEATKKVDEEGIESSTCCMLSNHSATELHARSDNYIRTRQYILSSTFGSHMLSFSFQPKKNLHNSLCTRSSLGDGDLAQRTPRLYADESALF